MVSASMTVALPAISATASWAEVTNHMARRKIKAAHRQGRSFREMVADLNAYRTKPVVIRHCCNEQSVIMPPNSRV
jgi:hypothetical protein